MKITTVAQYLFLGNSYFLQLFLISPYGLLNLQTFFREIVK